MAQRIGGRPRHIKPQSHGMDPRPVLPAIQRRDTSGDGVARRYDSSGGKINTAEWHRKVISDFNRWVEMNPGVPLYQGKKPR